MNLLALLFLPILVAPVDPRPALPPAPALQAPAASWDGDELNDYLNRQHEHTLCAVEAVLRRHRPELVGREDAERHLAMLALDEALHYDKPDSNESPAVKGFFTTRLGVAADEIEHTQVTDGAVIWKLYDHAFVVRTASVTIAFDLTRGYWGTTGSQPEAEAPTARIVDRCDALILSHNHGDHVDDWVVDRFLSQSKPVTAPADVRASDQRIIRPARDAALKQSVKLKNGRDLEMVVFPGYQGELPNNVSLVFTPEGTSFLHTGDLFSSNSTKVDQWEWIDHVKDRWKVDVLMINVWASKFSRTIDGFAPRLVFTGHENEMGHDPLKRKTNYLAYDRMAESQYPWVLMTWGESYWYSR